MNPWTPLVVATVGWGSAAVLTRALLGAGVPTLVIVPLRFTIALALLTVISRFWKRFKGMDRSHWVRGIVLGVVALALPNLLFTKGLEDLPVSIGGLLVALIPVATVGAAHFLVDDERFNARSIPGLMVSLTGAGILVGIGGETAAGVGNLWRGVGVSLIAVVLAGVGGALTRRFAVEVGGDGLVIPQFAGASALCLTVMMVTDPLPLGNVGGDGWAMLIALGALATAIPFTAFLMAAEVNNAARLALIGYMVPVIAVILAVLFLDERLTAPIVIGAILIIGGVILTERSSRHTPVPGVNTAR